MTKRTVVITDKRRGESKRAEEFTFTRDMVSDSPGDYRKKAWDAYESIALPTMRDEAWRRTDLRGLQLGSMHLPTDGQEQYSTIPEELLQPLVGQEHGGQIIITPSRTQANLASELAETGVVFCDLRSAEKLHPELVEKVRGQIVRPEEGKFAALAGAFADHGVLLYVPKGVQVEQPLHSIMWGPGKNLAYMTHVLVYLEEGATATYLHESASDTSDNGQAVHAGIVEIHIGVGANLRFVELQSWGEHFWNFSHERARVEQDGNIDWIFGAIGSHVTKNFSDLDLVGRGANGRMSGFYFTDGVQHLDHDTQQNHLAPDTTSDLLFKGALKDNSRSVWQGMIYVAPGAQKTDGYQANRNLILSPNARADSIPGLEIMADDVRCTHGATVGKVDPEQVFYILSRGIPREEAERLVVQGFFDPIMQRIPFDGVRERFHGAIIEKMG